MNGVFVTWGFFDGFWKDKIEKAKWSLCFLSSFQAGGDHNAKLGITILGTFLLCYSFC